MSMTASPNLIPPICRNLWDAYLATVSDPDGVAARYYETCRFGHTRENANKTAGLILTGTKTATASLVFEFELTGKLMPRVGSLTIVLDGQYEAVAVVETTEVKLVPFESIDADFARDYGEGDRTLGYWHTMMWRYYAEEAEKLGIPPSEDMPLVCEYFRLVYPSTARIVH